ncbi:MAG: hypothetical protein HYX75_23505 [Acidobacteria bacterium]|nr:hypothetical protein [Acidobacteriota bacterium]
MLAGHEELVITHQSKSPAVPRSPFVTAVGWVFLAFSAMGTFIGVLQNLMVATLFPVEKMNDAARADPEFAKLPIFFQFFMTHIWLWFALALLVSSTTLAASIGLLRRKDWGRRLMVVLLGLGVAWFVGSLGLAWSLFSSAPFHGQPVPPGFSGFLVVMQVFMVVFALGLAVLFVWIIRRLLSERIRAEFSA